MPSSNPVQVLRSGTGKLGVVAHAAVLLPELPAAPTASTAKQYFVSGFSSVTTVEALLAGRIAGRALSLRYTRYPLSIDDLSAHTSRTLVALSGAAFSPSGTAGGSGVTSTRGWMLSAVSKTLSSCDHSVDSSWFRFSAS